MNLRNEELNEIDDTPFEEEKIHMKDTKKELNEVKEDVNVDQFIVPIQNIGLALHDCEFTPNIFLYKTLLLLVFDVALIKACVDLAFDGFSSQRRSKPQSRTDVKEKRDEGLRTFLTQIVAGVLGKQNCLNRSICEIGNLFTVVKGKSLGFM